MSVIQTLPKKRFQFHENKLFDGILWVQNQKKIFNFTKYVVEHSFNVMRKDLGFNDITVLTLRNTFASRLAQLRVPILNMQQKKRLKNINITFEKFSFVYRNTFDMNVLDTEYGS